MKTATKIDLKTPEAAFHEWLVTNGIGGFACGSISGIPMRKYHSFLNAALPAPYGRTIMLNYIHESIIIANQPPIALSNVRLVGEEPFLSTHLVEFRIEDGIPIWKYEINGLLFEKSLFLVYNQNTLHISYKLLSNIENAFLQWRPFFHFRRNEEAVNVEIPNESYTVQARDFQYEIQCPHFPTLRIHSNAPTELLLVSEELPNVFYQTEAERGYESVGSLKSPGAFIVTLTPNKRISFVVSVESWETIFALSHNEAWHVERIRKKNLLRTAGEISKSPFLAKLVLAADQFIISPRTRFNDMVRLQAFGESVRTVIAGYPWFTDWGRDTMISLEGLTLLTGRSREAHSILHTFAYYIQDGLIPNMFPDGEVLGIYNTADATLWFFHAIDRYIDITGDGEILDFLLPKLQEIINQHIKGTRFGIKMDDDGLLMQGQEGYALTWMDAKMGDWIVTPRRGKAVEINALWYNALRLFEKWTKQPLDIAKKCYDSFNQKFWNAKTNCLYDVIEGKNGNDDALRPNQLFAISLTFPVLDKKHWKAVLDIVEKELLTPYGLRTLSPTHPDFKSSYDGDLRTRDGAYHQGTVWPWLIGPYIDVWLKVYPNETKQIYDILFVFEELLNKFCIGTIGEIFDAHAPYNVRGCFAQAWSIAEVLRSCINLKTHLKNSPYAEL